MAMRVEMDRSLVAQITIATTERPRGPAIAENPADHQFIAATALHYLREC
jgi:hypothetical protein